MMLNSNGYVGIGTTDPSTNLHIMGQMILEGASSTLSFNLDYAGAGDLLAGSRINPTGTNDNLSIHANGGGGAGSTVTGVAYNGSS